MARSVNDLKVTLKIMLPFEEDPEVLEEQLEEVKEKLEYVCRRPNHKGRAKLPTHLPVVEIEIYPEGNLSEKVCTSKEITEELECEPAKFYIKRYIRLNTRVKMAGEFRLASQQNER